MKYNIGLLSAMPEEIGLTLNNLENLKKTSYGSLEIFSGNWMGLESKGIRVNIITAWSGWGKVNAAYATTRLIAQANKQKLDLDLILFTGVAGAADPELKQWDVVVATSFVQHDMDARPIYKKYVIPGLNISKIETDKHLKNWALESLTKISKKSFDPFKKIYSGLIATGDKFIDNKKEMEFLVKNFNELKAVEMEGAAVAQVSNLESIPLLTIRVISDNADSNAASSFEKFLLEYQYKSWNLISWLLSNIMNIKK